MGGLDEERAGIPLTGPADVPDMRRAAARLADAGIQAEVADELVRAREPSDVPIAASSPSEATGPMPGIVSSRRTRRSSITIPASPASARRISASMPVRSRSAASTCSRSSAGNSTETSQRSPCTPNGSLQGELRRLRARIALIRLRSRRR